MIRFTRKLAPVLFSDVVATSERVAATRSRREKVRLLAAALSAADTDVGTVAAYLSGTMPQGRVGVGWRSTASLPTPSPTARLTVRAVDAALDRLVSLAGPGSSSRRSAELESLFAAATDVEQRALRALLTGEWRQGASEGLMVQAIAASSGVDEALVRRALMFTGTVQPVAVAARAGGAAALADVGLVVGRPVRPMLASSAPDVIAAVADASSEGLVAVECKLDGVRIQVHRRGDDVRVFTRSLDDITGRVPEVVELVGSLAADAVVLDGEAVALDAMGQPLPFQVTGARVASLADVTGLRAKTPLTPYLFDLLHLDGVDLLDEPLSVRRELLGRLVPPDALVPSLVTTDPAAAAAFFDVQVAAGHEGVVVKDVGSAYAAGRRGASWVKVKPRHTLDLVVLAVEWGSGRRRGLLSNIHLGARTPEGGFVMLGKTFKGMTDEMLAWQTARFLELEESRDGYAVRLRPEQVVEVAFDGIQTSSRYPGGMALRFARVLRYRTDKSAADADTIDTVRRLHARGHRNEPAE